MVYIVRIRGKKGAVGRGGSVERKGTDMVAKMRYVL